MNAHPPSSAAQELNFIKQVLTVFADADIHDSLWWRFDDGALTLFAMVNDVFEWACADAEEITPDTLPDLQGAYNDLKAIGATEWTPDLYAARRRGMRPQGAAYPVDAAVQALFNECGPAREVYRFARPEPMTVRFHAVLVDGRTLTTDRTAPTEGTKP